MKNFQHQRGWKNFLESWPVLVFLSVLLLFFAWGVIGFLKKMEITEQNKKIAEDNLVALQEQKETLSSDIANLKTPSGVEASIREKFGLAKDGEGEIIVVDDPTPPSAPATSFGGFWGFLKSLFR